MGYVISYLFYSASTLRASSTQGAQENIKEKGFYVNSHDSVYDSHLARGNNYVNYIFPLHIQQIRSMLPDLASALLLYM